MPTLMDVEVSEQETAGETAQTSDLAWMSREFRTMGNSNFENALADDSTLSGSFLTAALEEMRRNEKATQNVRDQIYATQRSVNRARKRLRMFLENTK
jgi:ketol-acid reductoisomerase